MDNPTESHVVLIVEDDPDIRDTLQDILDYEGYNPVGVADGREALDWLKEHPAPCLILLDLMMPRMSGWEFRTRQQQEPSLRSVPVVLVSGLGDTASEARRLQATAYLNKPINMKALLETVRTYC
jgi:CheY-like chemotaxis protein